MQKRKDIKTEDTWRLEDYYETLDDWQKDIDEIKSRLGEFESYKGHLAESADKVLGVLQFDDVLAMKMRRAFCYAYQHRDLDTRDARYQNWYATAQSTAVKYYTASAFIEQEIQKIPSDRLKQWLSEVPGLAQYRRTLECILRQKAHTASAEVEAVLAASKVLGNAPENIYDTFTGAELKFAPVFVDGEEKPLTIASFISFLENRDEKVREEAFHNFYKGYRTYRNTLASIFSANIAQASFYATQKSFQSSRDYYLYDANIPGSVYDSLIESVHGGMDVMYRYVELRKKVLGKDKLNMWDIYVPLTEDTGRRYTFEEAKSIVCEALKPLGEDYVEVVKDAFASRWVDPYETEGKRSGGYSISAYGCHPYVLMNFQGNLDGVSTLAHEMGHSMHTYYSTKTHNFRDSHYAIFVAEVASICNEALLNAYLLKKSSSREEKMAILDHYLSMFRATLYRQVMFAEFEDIVHKAYAEGTSLTSEYLCKVYHDLNVLYFGDQVNVCDEIDFEWSRIPHFYSPFYVYQYATGFAAAIALSQRLLNGGEEAVKAYRGFLCAGGFVDPIDALKAAGVDMSSPEPVKAAIRVFGEMLDEMEKLI